MKAIINEMFTGLGKEYNTPHGVTLNLTDGTQYMVEEREGVLVIRKQRGSDQRGSRKIFISPSSGINQIEIV